MNAALFALVLSTVFAPPATTSAERSTRIYVRTTPPGASIVLDGKELGRSDGLFLVPPGVRTITLEMDGYDPHGETLDVKEGWITRVEVRMVRKGEKPLEGAAATVASEKLYFVRWVIQDEETMTFEGAPVKPDELPWLLEKVPNRPQTVLEVGYSSEISVKLRNECVSRATVFAKQFGFKYASDIGEQKLGSKGSPPRAASDQAAGATNSVAREEPPEEVVRKLLEAARDGDNAKAASLFTPAARATIKELGWQVAPVKSSTATFAVGDVTHIEDGRARVTTSWTDYGTTTQMSWILRSGKEGWRIAGMETRVRDGVPPVLLDIENLEEARKNFRVLAEAAESSADFLSQVEQELLQRKIELEKELTQYGEQHPKIGELRARIKAAEMFLAIRKNGAEASARSQADSSLKATVYPLLGPGVRWHMGADGSMTFCNIPTTFEEVEGLAARVVHPRQATLLLEFELGVEQAVRERAEKLAAEWKRKFEFKGTFSCPPPGQSKSGRIRPDETPVNRLTGHIAPRKIHLPDADTKDTAVVLDLASGEMLRLPWKEPEGDAADFTKLGKGDLGFDSMLFCLRGGEVELFENGTAKAYKVNGRKDDAKIYQLPKDLPCELVVTTPEKRRFLVKVLAETAEGGLDIEYRQLGEKEAELAAGILELRIAANEEEAKTFAQTGKDLGWYDASHSMEDTSQFVTRVVDGQTQVLLWQVPEKSLAAARPGEEKWRVHEVSVIAEPGKPGRIGVVFDVEGGRRLRELTAANIDRRLAIVVDGRVVSCPTIRSPIGERVEISGNFSRAELATLATALQAGMETNRP